MQSNIGSGTDDASKHYVQSFESQQSIFNNTLNQTLYIFYTFFTPKYVRYAT